MTSDKKDVCRSRRNTLHDELNIIFSSKTELYIASYRDNYVGYQLKLYNIEEHSVPVAIISAEPIVNDPCFCESLCALVFAQCFCESSG